jgi:hypothetical protein
MQVSINQEQSTDYNYLSFNYNKAEQVPNQCVLAAKLLNSQPVFKGSTSGSGRSKVIPIKSWADTRIFDIFNMNAKELIEYNSMWRIYGFGCGNQQVVDAHDNRIKQGLGLCLDNDSQKCSLQTLKQAYSDVYRKMRGGWLKANPIEWQDDIFFKEDPQKFALFLKSRKLREEVALIRFLARKFGLRDAIRCDHVWNKEYHANDIYMWIQKDKLTEAIQKFGFDFQPLKPSQSKIDKKIEKTIKHINYLTPQSDKKSGGKRFRVRQRTLRDLAESASKRLQLLKLEKNFE